MTVEGIKAKLDEAGWYEDYYYAPGSNPPHWTEYIWTDGKNNIRLNYTTGQIMSYGGMPTTIITLDQLKTFFK